MAYDQIIRNALRLAKAPRRFASGGVPARNPSVNREENFKNWFGNSKVVDGEGKPWVHYHVTPKSFTEFIAGGHDPKLSGPAIWLTPHKYSQPAGHNVSLRGGAFREGTNVMPLYVKMENPLYVDESDKEEKNRLIKKFGITSYAWPMTIHPEDLKKIKDAGHDGIFHLNSYAKFNPETGEGLETIVFSPNQLKSAIGNSGNFDPSDPNITKTTGGAVGYASGGDVPPRQLDDRGFYSAAAESARAIPQAKGSPAQMMATMKGVKPSELEWSGAGKAFADQKTVTRDDLAQHFEQNAPKIEETVLGGKIDPAILRKRQEIANMYLPEIKKYENMSNTTHKDHHPDATIRQNAVVKAAEIEDKMIEHLNQEAPLPEMEPTKYESWTLPNNKSRSRKGYREVLLRLDHPDTLHQSSHWEEPNVIAHLRMQDRGPNNNILHLEEVQSDWAQQGRDEGFGFAPGELEKEKKQLKELVSKRNELRNINTKESNEMADKIQEEIRDRVDIGNSKYGKISKAPYVTNTDHWTELAMKRALIEAARGGYDKLVWTPGEEQAKRYSLGNHVDKIKYYPKRKYLVGYKNGEDVFSKLDVTVDNLHEYIGRELAEEIMQPQNSNYVENGVLTYNQLAGKQLFIGGLGMKKYYGEILPNALRRVLKPHTDKIQPTSHVVKNNEGEDVTLPGIEITPEMRESILKKGFPHYAAGGEVRQHFEDGGGAEGGSPAGDTGGSMGDTTGRDDAQVSDFGYSAPDENAPPPEMETEKGPYSHFQGVPVLGAMEKSLTTGPGLVGFIGGSPLGAIAYGMEAINNAYYGGQARADVDHSAGGPGAAEPSAVPSPQAPRPPGGFRLASDDEEAQAGMVKPMSIGAPPLVPATMASGGAASRHPALSIPGVHIREEIHGKPIFIGGRNG